MNRRVARLLVGVLMVMLAGAVPIVALGQAAAPVLVDPMPVGVSFQVLATADGTASPMHTDAMLLHRITVGCGQATGEIPGTEQITWVEHGQVDIHDWASGALITTLTAGQALGPIEQAFFLASPAGHSASVWHFSASGAGVVGSTLPPIAFETTDCGSGVTQPMATEAASVETIHQGETFGPSAPAGSYTLYAGVLMVAPGASIGQPYASGAGLTRYRANGTGVVMPVLGGFGDGSVGMAGIVVPEIPAGQVVPLVAGDWVALENFGAAPTIALLVGAVPAGSTIFSVQQ